jgi:hypothetical protein
MSPELLQHAFETNVFGLLRMAQLVLPGSLTGERDGLGGSERLLDVEEQQKAECGATIKMRIPRQSG